VRRAQYGLRFVPSRRLTKLAETWFHWIRETFQGWGYEAKTAPGTAGRSSAAVTDYLLEVISRHREGPFFVWGHYLDTHFPFAPPQEFAYDTSINSTIRREITEAMYRGHPLRPELSAYFDDLYDGEVRSAVHQVRRVLDFLKEHQLLDQTWVIVTSDHGQGFQEHGYWECPDDKFFDESIRVPLLIFNSQQLSRQLDVENVVSLMDLSPTILDLCGLPSENRFWGRSFAELLVQPSSRPSDRPVWIETLGPPRRICRVCGRRKAIYDLDSKILLGGHSEEDALVSADRVEQQTFLPDLKEYQQSKESFLLEITRK